MGEANVEMNIRHVRDAAKKPPRKEKKGEGRRGKPNGNKVDGINGKPGQRRKKRKRGRKGRKPNRRNGKKMPGRKQKFRRKLKRMRKVKKPVRNGKPPKVIERQAGCSNLTCLNS